MFYILYKTTNNINNKIYIGAHKTTNIDDGYLGSGWRLQRAIKKHGKENFTREVLEQFDTAAEMYAREREVVDEEFIKRPDVYNLRVGGKGGLRGSYEAGRSTSIEKLVEGRRQKMLTDPEFAERFRQHCAELGRLTQRNGKGLYGVNPDTGNRWYEDASPVGAAAAQTTEAREKRIASFERIGHQKGEKNSQFGSCWIRHVTTGESKKIKLVDLQPYLDEGWMRGRKMKGSK